MTYPEFEARWQPSGGAERANYGLFLTDLCDLLGVPRPDATTDSPAQDAYVLERAVTFDDGAGKKSIGRIDLYKRGCFVFETKQGVNQLSESVDNEGFLTNKNSATGARRERDGSATGAYKCLIIRDKTAGPARREAPQGPRPAQHAQVAPNDGGRPPAGPRLRAGPAGL